MVFALGAASGGGGVLGCTGMAPGGGTPIGGADGTEVAGGGPDMYPGRSPSGCGAQTPP